MTKLTRAIDSFTTELNFESSILESSFRTLSESLTSSLHISIKFTLQSHKDVFLKSGTRRSATSKPRIANAASKYCIPLKPFVPPPNDCCIERNT
ncbi:hypothetical protein Gasu2_28670 [Galdieria sulphuraria]|nr:hypothetical protein Gasu2_28670 [Galdieria sulphuraria]